MQRLISLYRKLYGSAPETIVPIAGDGSNRRYYRLDGAQRCIGTIGLQQRENEAFIYLSGYFRKHHLPVPEVFAVSEDRLAYLQEDSGCRSLYDCISSDGSEQHGDVMELLIRVMRELPRFHYSVDDDFNASKCFPLPSMSQKAIKWDLNYFKYCFLKPLGLEFDELDLENDFDYLAETLSANPDSTLMLRDFQSRNVMLDEDDQPTVIDFQGARLGDGLYDVASFVWQARANYSEAVKDALVKAYLESVIAIRGAILSDFDARLKRMILFRTLQVLGAYGFRGYVERKAKFITSIPKAVEHLRELLPAFPDNFCPSLMSVLKRMVVLPELQKPKEYSGLTVTVMSFSYKKGGIPTDSTGNGGGFVFDCRGMHNPGRYDQYKPLTGRDLPVIEFLEDRGEIQLFMDACYKLVDRSVECYIRRGFASLMVCFGCTGGQHRSVYGAEQMARHLSERYGVRIHLIHREQNIDEIIEPK